MEFKKHCRDFNAQEKDIINKCIKGKEFKLTQYTIYRKGQRKITQEEIDRIFKDYKIIEAHIKDGDVRVLLRGNKIEQGSVNICVVVSLNRGNIITSYYNHKNDLHANLDTSKYITYINILGLLKQVNTYSLNN